MTLRLNVTLDRHGLSPDRQMLSPRLETTRQILVAKLGNLAPSSLTYLNIFYVSFNLSSDIPTALVAESGVHFSQGTLITRLSDHRRIL